jgi:hypothetical protein
MKVSWIIKNNLFIKEFHWFKLVDTRFWILSKFESKKYITLAGSAKINREQGKIKFKAITQEKAEERYNF